MIDVNCDGKSNCANAGESERTHSGRSLFSISIWFSPQFVTRLSTFLCCAVCGSARTTTTKATIKVFQFMNVQQFRNTPATIRFVRASERWNKREHEKRKHSDGIIFITISCYQVKEHPLTLVSFDIANDLCARWWRGVAARPCGEMRSYLRLFFFRFRLLLLCGISIHFAMTRDGWLTGAETQFGFRLFAWSFSVEFFCVFFCFLLFAFRMGITVSRSSSCVQFRLYAHTPTEHHPAHTISKHVKCNRQSV